jgi:hypothetical protein
MDERKEPMISLRREKCLEFLEDYNECLHRDKEVRHVDEWQEKGCTGRAGAAQAHEDAEQRQRQGFVQLCALRFPVPGLPWRCPSAALRGCRRRRCMRKLLVTCTAQLQLASKCGVSRPCWFPQRTRRQLIERERRAQLAGGVAKVAAH